MNRSPTSLILPLAASVALGVCVAGAFLQATSMPEPWAGATGPAGGAGFRAALPGYQYEFPRDHGRHDDFRTEWWYFTGHLESRGGKHYGFELTFFRVGVEAPSATPGSPWDLHDLALAHFAITDIDRGRFRFSEKLNRASPYTAGAALGRLEVHNEGWSVHTLGDGSYRLLAQSGGDTIDLRLQSKKPPAVHGENGISVKAEGIGYASHYYSLSRIEVEGSITVAGTNDRCRGLAWMDHEFGSSALRENQQGWDWFSVQLDNDTELMLYQIRRRDGTSDLSSSGSLITTDGGVIHLKRGDFTVSTLSHWHSPNSGGTYPMGWTISVVPLKLRVTLRPVMQDQELITSGSTGVTYWEGAVGAIGSFAGTPVTGAGYVEMTGYAGRFPGR
jgi:predicted secreted hydrolase